MNAAEIAALAAGIPTVLGAVTALIIAIRGNGKANANAAAIKSNAAAIAVHANMLLNLGGPAAAPPNTGKTTAGPPNTMAGST
jgi:hypothetical protein